MLPAALLPFKKTKAGILLFFIVIGLLFSTVLKAQITVKGIVKNKKDGSPVAFTTIKQQETGKTITTDLKGNYILQVAAFPTILEFTAGGFDIYKVQLSKEIKLKADSTFVLDVTLKDTAAPDEVYVPIYDSLGEVYGSRSYSSTTSDMSTASAGALSGKASGLDVRGSFAMASGRERSLRKSTAKKTPAASSTGLKYFEHDSAPKDRSPLAYEHLEEFKKVKKSLRADDKGAMSSEVIYDSLSLPKPVKRTSLLTAGEVNDFKKWKMWEDYNETDFKAHSDHWNLYATQRYSVQLQNKDAKAITGETVYLINKETKAILWTAVSDNTGKAELWNGFDNNSKERNVAIKIKGEKEEFAAIPFSQGINHINLKRSCNISNRVEIAFVVDATGSMQDEIEYLKEELGDILTKFSMKDPSLDLNTSAVFYRDKSDAYITRVQPFSNNISTTIGFIREQSADGGGDYPEALNDALKDATSKLEWSENARTKIIFLLMDAPPHDEAKSEMAVLTIAAASKGIRIVPVACSGTDKATEFIMRSMALATNGTYLFLTDDSGIGNAHIKPTTDEFKVELLNDLLLRIMEQMCFANACDESKKVNEPVSLYENKENVKVFPNPSAGPVTLQTEKELKEIFVADFTGKILRRIMPKGSKRQYKIDLSGFPSATYFIRYITTDGKTGAEKIVLMH